MAGQVLQRKLSAKLSRFLQPITEVCDKVRQRFIRQSVAAIVGSGSLVVTEMARRLCRPGETLDYVAKRLCRQFLSSHWNLAPLQEAYLKSVAGQVHEDTVVAVDLSDLAKPRGRRFQYLALVRDADKDQIQPGYWCMEAYAVLGEDFLPLYLEPFSVDDPATPSQNLAIEAALGKLKTALGGRGVFTFDRGFDGGEILNFLLDQKLRFVVRLRGDRHLSLPDGSRLAAADLADRLTTRKACWRWRRKTRRWETHYVGFQKAYLPDREEPLGLVLSVLPGHEDGVMLLLTNVPVTNFVEAERVWRWYAKRWKAEDGIRLFKQQAGLEGFRLRNLEAIRRLIFLAMLAVALVVRLALESLTLAERVVRLGRPLRRAGGPIYYRLTRALQFILTPLAPNRLLFIKGLQNG